MFFDISGFFICTIQNKFVPLHREPAPGMSVHRQRRVADILKRRLLALCSDSMKLRNFQLYAGLSNDRCPTGYRLSLCAYLVRLLRIYACAHAYLNYVARELFIFGVGFALSVSYNGQCEGLIEWNGNSRTPRFFYMPI